ncbi:hypothetical protein D3C76_248330 [compost metagenome]
MGNGLSSLHFSLVLTRFSLSPGAMFAICLALIALGSSASDVLIEKRRYHQIKGWFDSRLAVVATTALTRRNY